MISMDKVSVCTELFVPTHSFDFCKCCSCGHTCHECKQIHYGFELETVKGCKLLLIIFFFLVLFMFLLFYCQHLIILKEFICQFRDITIILDSGSIIDFLGKRGI